MELLIADDHPLFRYAIKDIVQTRYTDCRFYESLDAETTLKIAASTPSLDLILLDLNMPGMTRLNGLLELRNQCPTIPVVVISAEQSKNTILQTIAYGAVGYIPKSLPMEQILAALDSIMAGNVYLPPNIMRTSDAPAHHQQDNGFSSDKLSALTKREMMVLEQMTRGDANKQIAHHLNISETTVKSHVSSILKKLGVYNRVQAVLGCGNIDFSQF